MTLQFEIFDGEGTFLFSEATEAANQQLGELLDQRDYGKLSSRAYMTALERLVADDPAFIDGHTHLGYALFDQGKTKKGLEACLAGVAAAEAAIPKGFDGTTPWGFLENRPYLRALHGVALGYLRLKQRKNAIPLLEKMLRLNPNDNQGIRYLVGPEYLRTGKTDKAREILEAEADSYPSYHYELGLLHMGKGEWVEATTSLRRGFATNAYIAEALLGNPAPAPLPIWHGSNFGDADMATDYVAQYGDYWARFPDLLQFLNWLYHHSAVLTERAETQWCREELLWEQDVEQRKAILERQQQALEKISDTLSEQIIQKRQDRDGRMIYPWYYRPINIGAYFR